MKFSEIVAHFENETDLPIKPERIAKLLKEGGVVEQVVFVGVEIDTAILKGKFVRLLYEEIPSSHLPRPYEIPDNGLLIKVYYDKNLPEDERRLVVNKELLHAVDPDFVRTATEADAKALAHRLRLPRELWMGKNSKDDDSRERLTALIDYMSDYRAVILMVPQKIRSLICAQYAAKKINEDEIATLTGIPRKYIAFILDESWDKLKKVWCNGLDAIEV